MVIRHAHRHGARHAVIIQLRRGGAQRVAGRAHAVLHRVAHRHPGRALKVLQLPRIHDLFRLQHRHRLRGAIAEDEGLGLGHRQNAGQPLAGLAGDQRKTFALTLQNEIYDEKSEEDPERIKRELGNVDIGGNGAGWHDGPLRFLLHED
jgi:hypothetical protein